jgi:hypothetical protein
MTVTVVENGSGVDALPSSRHSGRPETKPSPLRTLDVTPDISICADRGPITNRLVRLISDFRTPLSLLAGALLGRFVYAVNVYGTTTIFRRFEAVAVPVAFGIAAAGVYKRCSQAAVCSRPRCKERALTGGCTMNEIVPDIFTWSWFSEPQAPRRVEVGKALDGPRHA